MGDPNKSVVKAGGSSVNTIRNAGQATGGGGSTAKLNVTSNPTLVGGYVEGGYIIGAKYPDFYGENLFPELDTKYCGTCGHTPTTVIVAGCWEGQDLFSWLTCRKCQMETLWQIKNSPGLVYMQCGHHWGDLVYSYLPNDSEFDTLGNRMWDVKSNLVH